MTVVSLYVEDFRTLHEAALHMLPVLEDILEVHLDGCVTSQYAQVLVALAAATTVRVWDETHFIEIAL